MSVLDTSRSRTILSALRRLSVLDIKDNSVIEENNVNLKMLILGADRNEGTTNEGTLEILRDFLIASVKERTRTKMITIDLVGPNLQVGENRMKRMVDIEGVCVKISRTPELYHEIDFSRHSSGRISYDVVFCFNAGVWGYKDSDWLETFRALPENVAIVVTAYSLEECEMDEDRIREYCTNEAIEFLWEAEESEGNFGKVREGEFNGGHENFAWLCFRRLDDSKQN